MKVAVVTGSLSRYGGGVSASVQEFSRSLNASNTDVRVMGIRDNGWEDDARGWVDVPTSCLTAIGPSAVGFSLRARHCLREFQPDIVHSHGLWKLTSRTVSQWAAVTGRPVVVSPHGMLDAWALKRSIWKKRIAAYLYENEHLRRAGCLHALCDAEAGTIRALGFTNPICVIPNGITLPALDDSRPAPWPQEIPENSRVMLFLGRLHPKKNLRALIEAWPDESAHWGWHLAIAGWDQCGHEADLRALVSKRQIGTSIHFLGPLFGQKKDAALRRAAACILPSLSEGLPMATLEAWAYSRPVLQTEACNLPEGFRECAAIRIASTVPEMAADLRAAMRLAPDTLGVLGRNGRRLAERNFCWHGVARQMRDVYSWLLDGGERPACVRLDGGSSSHAA